MLDIRIDETDFDRAMQQLKGIPWAIQKAFVPAVSEVMDHIRLHLGPKQSPTTHPLRSGAGRDHSPPRQAPSSVARFHVLAQDGRTP